MQSAHFTSRGTSQDISAFETHRVSEQASERIDGSGDGSGGGGGGGGGGDGRCEAKTAAAAAEEEEEEEACMRVVRWRRR